MGVGGSTLDSTDLAEVRDLDGAHWGESKSGSGTPLLVRTGLPACAGVTVRVSGSESINLIVGPVEMGGM
jgi:hypothetical protein